MRLKGIGLTGFAKVLAMALSCAAAGHADADSASGIPAQIVFTWQISEGDKQRLYEHVKALRYGDKLENVRATLGVPNWEGDWGDKQGRFRFRSLEYAIRRVRPEGGNVYDQEITLNFDEQNRLVEIWYNALPPLSGDITGQCTPPGTKVECTYTKPPLP
jgi:hypothetical protein